MVQFAQGCLHCLSWAALFRSWCHSAKLHFLLSPGLPKWLVDLKRSLAVPGADQTTSLFLALPTKLYSWLNSSSNTRFGFGLPWFFSQLSPSLLGLVTQYHIQLLLLKLIRFIHFCSMQEANPIWYYLQRPSASVIIEMKFTILIFCAVVF